MNHEKWKTCFVQIWNPNPGLITLLQNVFEIDAVKGDRQDWGHHTKISILRTIAVHIGILWSEKVVPKLICSTKVLNHIEISFLKVKSQ